MEQTFSGYWWLVIPVVLAFLALLFSLERRGGKVKQIYPQNYIDGLKALIANDESDAFVKLKQAVADDTNNADAYLKLGDLFRNRGQFEKAIRIHRELILRKSITTEMVSQVRKSLVIDYMQTKRYETALEELAILVKDSGHRIWANEKMLEVYELTNQWEKALNIGKSLLKSKDQQYKLAVYRYLAGKELYDEGEFHKARLAFKEAIKYDEVFADPYIMIAESYLAEDRKKDAVEFFKKLAEKAPSEFYRVVDKIEETLYSLGHFSEVEAVYRKILSDNPDDIEILKSVAGIEEKKGNTKGATDYLQQVVNEHPNDGAAAAKLMELYITGDEREKAYDLLNMIKEKCNHSPHQYRCPHCKNKTSTPEITCPNCNRVGPYNKV